MGIDVAEDIVHQRIAVIGADGAGRNLLNAARGDIQAQPGLFRRRDRLTGYRPHQVDDMARCFVHILIHLLGAKVGKRIAFANAAHRHRAIKPQIEFALIGHTNIKARETVLQQRLKRQQHAAVQRLHLQQRAFAVFLRNLIQQVGQTGTNRHLAAEQLHAIARARLNRQLIAAKPLPHLGHIALQRGAADKPLLRQIFQLNGPGGGQKTRQQIVYSLVRRARHAQPRRRLLTQPLVARRIVNA
ncbi:MAG: hypothetical protein KIB04_04655 [Pantoea sp.]|nr:hypothetical protein [Pantoea sp.]